MTLKEQRELIKRAENGDEQAVDQLRDILHGAIDKVDAATVCQVCKDILFMGINKN